MTPSNRRTFLRAACGAGTVGLLAGCLGSDDEDRTDANGDDEGEELATLRVGQFSPDAPTVDVYVDGDRVATELFFTEFRPGVEVPAGDREIEFTAFEEPDDVVVEDTFTFEGGTSSSVVALGDVEAAHEALTVEAYEDDPASSDDTRLRLIHTSPNAGPIDVTVDDGTTVLFEDIAFAEERTTTVEADKHELEIRHAAADTDGDVIDTFPLTVEESNGAVTFTTGLVEPDETSEDESFGLLSASESAWYGAD